MRGDVNAELQPSQIEVANSTTSNLFYAALPNANLSMPRRQWHEASFSKTAAMSLPRIAVK
jgi:hypothetical protein